MSDTVEVEFEHPNMQQGAISLPSGLRDKAEIEDGTFTVEFSASDSLVSNPTFRALVDSGNAPISGVPDEQSETVQRRLNDDATDDTDSATEDDSAADSTPSDADSADDLDDMDRSELYELAHKLDAVDDDEIPEWNESSVDELRALIRGSVDGGNFSE